jgi:hypothetical protein
MPRKRQVPTQRISSIIPLPKYGLETPDSGESDIRKLSALAPLPSSDPDPYGQANLELGPKATKRVESLNFLADAFSVFIFKRQHLVCSGGVNCSSSSIMSQNLLLLNNTYVIHYEFSDLGKSIAGLLDLEIVSHGFLVR